MANRVRELYDGPGDEGKCAGQDECQVYLGAAQDSPDPAENLENREAACAAAGKFCARLYAVDEESLEMVSSIQAIVRRRDSAREPVDLTLLSELEWEMLKLWDSLSEEYERKHKRRLNEMFEVMAAMSLHR